VTAGHRNDAPQASALLEGVKGTYVLADRGYDANHIVDTIESIGAKAVIPPRSNRIEQREYDQELYKERNIIERLFNRMKHYRHFSTRYDKQSIHFESFIYFIAICIWLK
jgi:transposase